MAGPSSRDRAIYRADDRPITELHLQREKSTANHLQRGRAEWGLAIGLPAVDLKTGKDILLQGVHLVFNLWFSLFDLLLSIAVDNVPTIIASRDVARDEARAGSPLFSSHTCLGQAWSGYLLHDHAELSPTRATRVSLP